MDAIEGKAILSDASPVDGYEYLFVVCVSHDRKTVRSAAIPVRELAEPNPGNKGWQYSVAGDRLHVTPSLKLSILVDSHSPGGTEQESFHNAGSWSVLFVRKPLDKCSDSFRGINYPLLCELKEKGYTSFV